jgi:hypothetical protein
MCHIGLASCRPASIYSAFREWRDYPNLANIIYPSSLKVTNIEDCHLLKSYFLVKSRSELLIHAVIAVYARDHARDGPYVV